MHLSSFITMERVRKNILLTMQIAREFLIGKKKKFLAFVFIYLRYFEDNQHKDLNEFLIYLYIFC